MSKETVISKQELELLKSNGTVHICRSCRDLRNKIVLMEYNPSKKLGILEGFCSECIAAIETCGTCKYKDER